VAEIQNEVAGYAYASQWRSRSAYRYTAESTVYLDPVHTGKGIGNALYKDLIERLKAMGIHVVMGVITLPNPPSIALHEKLGFKKAAHFVEVGYKFGRWLDVGYWQLNL
jgi:phosphinothricin acetyltransferase